MTEKNRAMYEFLKNHGIEATPMFIKEGSMKGCWRLSGKVANARKIANLLDRYQKWTPEITQKLTDLGFVGFDGQPLGIYSGNGGLFATFVRPTKENPFFRVTA